MEWGSSTAGLLMLMGAAFFGATAVYVWRRGGAAGVSLAFVLLATTQWSLAYALELTARDLDARLFWGDLKFLGLCLLPPAWFAFTFQYAGRWRWVSWRTIGLLAVVNLGEDRLAEADATARRVERELGVPTVALPAALEAEAAELPADEAAAFLAEYGVERGGLDQVVGAAWRLLDLLTFLTTGEDETRAWEVRRGATAAEAAGRIHSDLERGFIRAEVVSYDDLVAAGGWDAARSKGLLRTEGRSYVVAEGEVLHVRFNV